MALLRWPPGHLGSWRARDRRREGAGHKTCFILTGVVDTKAGLAFHESGSGC